jgi:YVTN family beta-propeller protein
MKTKFLYLFVLLIGFTACEKDDPIVDNPYIPGSEGVFILNEGSWGGNNSTLTYHNFNTKTTTADIFGGKLGDTAQDMIAYGGKLYITVSESNCIHVLDLPTSQLLQTIANIEKPRYLAVYGGKVYATAYGTTTGEVLKIDTTLLSVEKTIPVGANPEGIAVAANGKIYVANGGYGAGNTVSVINTATFTAENPITVRINPNMVHADNQGNVYLTTQGNFGYSEPVDLGGIQKINTQTNTVANIDIPANSKFVIDGDLLYFYGSFTNYATGEFSPISFGVYNTKTEKLTADPIISDGTVIANPYAIGVNPKTKEVYISDGNYTANGYVYVFDTDGKKKNTIQAGISANAFAFY